MRLYIGEVIIKTVCVYIHTQKYIHIYVHIYIHICVYICVYIYMYIYIDIIFKYNLNLLILIQVLTVTNVFYVFTILSFK